MKKLFFSLFVIFTIQSCGTKNHSSEELWARDDKTAVVEIISPVTGRIWMDRNLGAIRAATSSSDSLSYGDLYQWGRGADGHQLRKSPTTSLLSSTIHPEHGSFILSDSNGNWDWLSPQYKKLWQGIKGENNPCPLGYRLPTESEWRAEYSSWEINNATGAFASPLKLPATGAREPRNGSIIFEGMHGVYWSSTILDGEVRGLGFSSDTLHMIYFDNARGLSVRCIKN